MPMKKTIREALIILLITMLLTLAFSILSPVGRILLKKGLRIKTAAVYSLMIPGRPDKK